MMKIFVSLKCFLALSLTGEFSFNITFDFKFVGNNAQRKVDTHVVQYHRYVIRFVCNRFVNKKSNDPWK